MTHNSDTAKELRDAALLVLKARGQFKITDDGVCVYVYNDEQIRIGYQPAIAGASMPSVIEISETLAVDAVKVFTVYWFQDGRFEVIRHKSGPWHDTLQLLAAKPPTESVGGHGRRGHHRPHRGNAPRQEKRKSENGESHQSPDPP